MVGEFDCITLLARCFTFPWWNSGSAQARISESQFPLPHLNLTLESDGLPQAEKATTFICARDYHSHATSRERAPTHSSSAPLLCLPFASTYRNCASSEGYLVLAADSVSSISPPVE